LNKAAVILITRRKKNKQEEKVRDDKNENCHRYTYISSKIQNCDVFGMKFTSQFFFASQK
jgi:hypothetical protein